MTIENGNGYEPKNKLLERIKARLKDPGYVPFELNNSFVNRYRNVSAPFGFNGLGELVYLRTYSRIKEDGSNEKWYETVQRVVNGTYNMQKRWIVERGIHWDDSKGQDSAQEMFDKIFNMKFLPPGRGLWAMGSQITEERGLYAALNNCAFVSTEDIKDKGASPFQFLMDASMLGVGVGFDTKGAGKLIVKSPDRRRRADPYIIPDSREGWVESVGMLIDSYLIGTPEVKFDYHQVRPAGQLIKGFGGHSSGAEPLEEAHEEIREVLEKNSGRPLTERTIVDIQNILGKCVVAGNVRRTAEISFGDPYSEDYLDLKDYKKNPDRESFGWTSNNSVFAELGMDYKEIEKRIRINGEPGLAWLENMKDFSRMNGTRDHKDRRAAGGNPCLEQTLESYELCCLVETFPERHKDLDEFLRTLKFSYLYAKTVTLGETHWPETNRVLLRNRRIGNSMSGLAQFVTHRGLDELIKWSEEGYNTIQKYDGVYSDWLTIPKSVKTTSIKPSGTVSLLAGATPGIHYPESEFYIRRMRIANGSPLIEPLKDAGYKIEPCFGSEDSTSVVEIPVHVGEGIRSLSQVSMWEQLSFAALMQKHWADNQVSCTITFDPEKEGSQIADALNYFQYSLKGISFLPKLDGGAYNQMPYEEISKERYKEYMNRLTPVNFSKIAAVEAIPERFCDSSTCNIDESHETDKK